jgi:hypothetical protein
MEQFRYPYEQDCPLHLLSHTHLHMRPICQPFTQPLFSLSSPSPVAGYLLAWRWSRCVWWSRRRAGWVASWWGHVAAAGDGEATPAVGIHGVGCSVVVVMGSSPVLAKLGNNRCHHSHEWTSPLVSGEGGDRGGPRSGWGKASPAMGEGATGGGCVRRRGRRREMQDVVRVGWKGTTTRVGELPEHMQGSPLVEAVKVHGLAPHCQRGLH